MRLHHGMKKLAIAAFVAALGLSTALVSPAGAAPIGQCAESATVSAGVPDLFATSMISNPLVVNVPLLGTPDLFTGPSCNFQVHSSGGPLEARLLVNSAAGLVSGQMTIFTSSPFGSQQQTLTCGPASGACEASSLVFAPGTSSISARCSVSGVVGALTGVSCSLSTTT